MHLIFIRHGDPDYKNNTVTEKGKREVQLLTERVIRWKVTDFYTSSYGRARDTISPSLKKLGRKDTVCKWLREFDVEVKDQVTGNKKAVLWDLMPFDYYGQEKFSDPKLWLDTPHMESGLVKERWAEVTAGIDGILEKYGYERFSPDEPVYKCIPHLTKDAALIDTHLNPFQDDLDPKNIVFTCHLGVMFAVIAHLTGISPVQLWQSFFVAPTSVTVLGVQERNPGEAVFRVQTMGDVSHLSQAGEPASASGYFGNYTMF